jgi:dipeptidyl aminopeptidase/acylaminoacyl peptidase
MAISGGSAGGYTVLCALTFTNAFHAGASRYGISDLEALVRDTHKFESRYPLWLVGPYPEARDRYRERSPLHFADRISAPVIFLQGEEDRVVPPNQTESMANALRAAGKLFGLVMFAGEQHGFRQAATIRRALDAELDFFSVVLTRSGLRL